MGTERTLLTAHRRRRARVLPATAASGIIRVMAYDEHLAQRIRDLVAIEPGLTEKAMFGGLAFLINGNMAVSASGQGGVLLRIDPAHTDELAAKPHAARFVMRGREMDGWLRIDPAGLTTSEQLARWVTRGLNYVRSLPPK